MSKLDFQVGRRWKNKSEGRMSRCADFEFVIKGPPDPPAKNAKMCELVCLTHPRGRQDDWMCCHGTRQNYSHRHLKKYATVQEENELKRKS